MNVKHGFSSTLNRFLGKKNKGHHLSKSATNLSISPHHIETIPISSHLEQNRITPLPVAAAKNVPFEQTFRITVLLPKGQLYVARLGAKTTLEKLLELVCDNKQLDPEKYEFRHPVDTSQVFNCELTIGAVGLSEIRLCHKSETYDNFNADEIIKLRHGTGRDSLSSSEFSSRNSKHTLKTASPYSSTNSLNSIDSTGMSTNYRGPILSLPPQSVLHRTISSNNNNNSQQQHHHPPPPPVAPARKKRAAPRPPSQNSIPEREVITRNNTENKGFQSEFVQPKKDFHVSSPNLNQCTELTELRHTDFHQSNISIDCNGNNSSSRNNNNKNNLNGFDGGQPPKSVTSNGHSLTCSNEDFNSINKLNNKMRPVSVCVMNNDSNNYNNNNTVDNSSNRNNGGSSNTSEIDLSSQRSSNGSIPGYTRCESTETIKMPEPIPRKRITAAAKKKAPAPPPRSVHPPKASPRITAPATAETPIFSERETTETKEVVDEHVLQRKDSIKKPLNDIRPEFECQTFENNVKLAECSKELSSSENLHHNQRVEETIEKNNIDKNEIPKSKELHEVSTTDTVPIPINRNKEGISNTTSTDLIEKTSLSPRESIKSSSDEEEIKVYNIKLGKTIMKTVSPPERKVNAALEVTTEATKLDNMNLKVENERDQAEINSLRSESPGWTYTIPAPPNFADTPDSSSLATVESETIKSVIEKNSTIENIESPVNSTDSSLKSIIKEQHSSDFDESKIQADNITSETIVNSENLITSDIEDGYRIGMDKELQKTSLEENKQEGEKQEARNQGLDEKLKTMEQQDQPSIDKNLKAPEKYKLNGENNGLIEDYQSIKAQNSLNSLESYDSNRSDVINELSNVINEQKIETLIRKSEDVDGIEGVKPCGLSNFKIQTYNNHPNGPIKTFVENHHQQSGDKINGDLMKSDVVKAQKQVQEQEQQHQHQNGELNHVNEEKLYKKRSSLTLSNSTVSQLVRSRALISRSDSFHSTRCSENFDVFSNGNRNCGGSGGVGIDAGNTGNTTGNSLQLKSSSFMSLINAQKMSDYKLYNNRNENFHSINRHKSTSELRIGESPILQSLNVMKTILNSRKNQFNNENNLLQKSSINQIHVNNNNINNNNNNISEKTQSNSPQLVETRYDCDSSKENSPKNKILSQQVTTVERLEKTTMNEPEKKWKYQGPPSINVSTWSERPKVQVSIKDDSDYKFGKCGGGGGIGNDTISSGGNSGNNATTKGEQGNENIVTLNVNGKIVNSATPIPATNSDQRNRNRNMAQNNSAIIEISSNNSNIVTTNPVRISNKQSKIPFVRSVEYKKITNNAPLPAPAPVQQGENDINNSTTEINSSRFFKPLITATNTMTLGRMPKINRTNFVPTVKGFKNIDIVTEDKKWKDANDQHHQYHQYPYSTSQTITVNNIGKTNSTNGVQRNNSKSSSSHSAVVERNVLKLSNQNNVQNCNKPDVGNNGLEENVLKVSYQNNKNFIQQKNINENNESATNGGNIISPFQITLRKTGLKEKILLRDEMDNKINSPVSQHEQQQNCSKLELKLSPPGRTSRIEPGASIEKTPSSQQQSSSVYLPPPPPPPPVIRSVVTKQNPGINRTSSIPAVVDPRDQLLAAIRNFNKDSLGKRT